MPDPAFFEWKEMSRSLSGNIRQYLAIHLVYTVLGAVLFAPLLGIVGPWLLRLSGQSILSDFDILYFFLTPTGVVSVIVFSALLTSILVFELASMMVIARGDHGHPVGPAQALAFTFARTKTIFIFAVQLVTRLFVVVMPFFGICAVIGWLLLGEYDINYYLSERPPAFWGAAASAGSVLLVMTGLLLRKLADWSMALPLLLFSGESAGKSFTRSAEQVMGRRYRLLKIGAIWISVAVLANIILLFSLQFAGSQLIPFCYRSMELLVAVLGTLVALFFFANFFLSALIIAGCSSFLLIAAAQYELKPAGENATTIRQNGFSGLTKPRLVFVLVGLVAVSAYSANALIQGVQSEDHALIIAHRGAAGRAPENTLAAVRAAVEDGADWVEIDVQESRDGKLVVIHDSDLMKLAGVNRKVWDMNLAELKTIDVGTWFSDEFSAERIPTLDEVLEEVHGRSKLLIELKYYGHDRQLEQRVVETVERAGMVAEVAVMSLQRSGIDKLQGLRPDWKTGLLLSKTIGNLSGLEMNFLAVNMATTGPGFIRRVHESGKEVFVWTVNDQLSMSRMISLGVNGIITDEPKMARLVLRQRQALNSVERLLLHAAVLLDQPVPGKEYRDQSP